MKHTTKSIVANLIAIYHSSIGADLAYFLWNADINDSLCR